MRYRMSLLWCSICVVIVGMWLVDRYFLLRRMDGLQAVIREITINNYRDDELARSRIEDDLRAFSAEITTVTVLGDEKLDEEGDK